MILSPLTVLIANLILVASVTATPRQILNASDLGCNQGNSSSLEPWQQVLIRDYTTTSELGHLCFDTSQGLSDGHAQALWILGMKARSALA